MNFFGHAVVAAERTDAPAFVLGAMLPDLVGMAGLRLGSLEDDALRAGVEFHHRTDDAFHGAPLFIALMNQAHAWLEAHGVTWGPAMAVAHVGTELLLDGALARSGVEPLYRAALGDGVAAPRWAAPEDAHGRYAALRSRLRDSPIPAAYGEPAFTASRVALTLSRRPRLALAPGQEAIVCTWAEQAAPEVAAHAADLLEQVRQRLGDPRTDR